MTLITSISGIRGTIGGGAGEGLNPVDLSRFTAAFGAYLRIKHPGVRLRVVLGRDARLSGPMVSHVVTGTLMGMGIDVTDLGLTTTPTAELAVTGLNAHGGIILTASHNPEQWNALKLLGHTGEFLAAADGNRVMEIASEGNFIFAGVHELGTYQTDDTWIEKHIALITADPLVDADAIARAGFRVAVDAVCSTGGIAVPALLEALNVDVVKLHCEPTGVFPHNPEPLPAHIGEICDAVVKHHADAGVVVDPDVDRLAIIDETGRPMGEEYTLVAVADYVLQHTPGNTVSNLSSTGALKVVTERYGGSYFASAVGEVNVVEMMKAREAVIGGEGNGGVIYPALHYGRDALAGIALFLTYMARSGKRCSEIRRQYPDLFISKNKIEFSPGIAIGKMLDALVEKYSSKPVLTIDGVKIHFGSDWVHLRRSNTEPIVRIYAESSTPEMADRLAMQIMNDFREIQQTM